MANDMNAHNLHSTDIDRNQETKNDPEFTKSFYRGFIFAVAVAVICVIGIVYTLLNAELIDNIKPIVQVIIFGVACGVFGLVRFVLWIRQL